MQGGYCNFDGLFRDFIFEYPPVSILDLNFCASKVSKSSFMSWHNLWHLDALLCVKSHQRCILDPWWHYWHDSALDKKSFTDGILSLSKDHWSTHADSRRVARIPSRPPTFSGKRERGTTKQTWLFGLFTGRKELICKSLFFVKTFCLTLCL